MVLSRWPLAMTSTTSRLTGALHAIGRQGQKPTPPLNLVGDYGGGALYLVTGLLAAIISARATGAGQVVDAAMVDGALSLDDADLRDEGRRTADRASGRKPTRLGRLFL